MFIIFSVNTTDIVIDFHDPSQFLKTATKIQYFWFIDDVNHGQTDQGVFHINLSTPGVYRVEARVIAYFNSTNYQYDISSSQDSYMDQRA